MEGGSTDHPPPTPSPPQYSESNIEVTTSTNPSTKAMIKADNATHMDDITGVARGTTASTGQCENGCSVTGEARKDDTDTPASAPSDSEDAKSLYSSVEVEVLNGTISWPAASECTAVAGYDNAIPPRKNIDLDMTNAEDPTITETTPSRRQLHEMGGFCNSAFLETKLTYLKLTGKKNSSPRSPFSPLHFPFPQT